MTRKQKKFLKRIIIATILFLILLITNLIISSCNESLPNGIASLFNFKYNWIINFILYFLIYLYIGHDVLKKSFINIIHGQLFDEKFLMMIATIGAFSLGLYTGFSSGKPEGFDEACAVLLFYQVGEWFQSYSASRSRKSIKDLMNIRPDSANIIRNGNVEEVYPDEVKVGDIILVRVGERVPLDGKIIKGSTSLDTSSLTGESLPLDVSVNDNILSGSINLTSEIEVEVSKEFQASTVSKILELVESATLKKSKSENFINKFAKVYTPIVVFLALALFIIPTCVDLINNKHTFNIWLYRSLSFLVVSCPCALVISVPMTFFQALGGASANNILIKGSVYLEKINKVNMFVFDKTGTLTHGNFKISKIEPIDKKEEILRLASIAERGLNHPISLSITSYYNKEIDNNYVIENIQGFGSVAKGSDTIICGNAKLLKKYNINFNEIDDSGTIVYVAKNNEYIGYILIEDEIKEEASNTIKELNKNSKTVILTGDNKKVAEKVSSKLNVTEVYSSLLPDQKSEYVNEFKKTNVVSFVGDGINDAPVLACSDVGISMGGIGSDAAIEASDIVIMNDDISKLITLRKIAKKAMRIVYENITFSLFIKVLILILSAFGITNMWFSVFGDVGVAIIAILNAMRANKKF